MITLLLTICIIGLGLHAWHLERKIGKLANNLDTETAARMTCDAHIGDGLTLKFHNLHKCLESQLNLIERLPKFFVTKSAHAASICDIQTKLAALEPKLEDGEESRD